MGKRRTSESNGVVLKKPKDDSDSESGFPEDTVVEELNINYEPDQMRVLVDSFSTFCENNETATVKNLERLVTEWAEQKKTEDDEYIDVTMFCQDYKKYLKTSLKVSNMRISDSTRVTLKYLQDEKALADFKDFPPKPLQVIQIYIKNKNLSKQLNDLGAAYDQLKKESPKYIEEIQEMHRKQEREYVNALSDFVKNHPHLTESQMSAIDAKTKAILKRIDKGTTPARRTTGTPKRKEPETAFSLWARTKAEKYRELSDEAREEKLRKKFEKLSPSELKLLDDLAMASGK